MTSATRAVDMAARRPSGVFSEAGFELLSERRSSQPGVTPCAVEAAAPPADVFVVETGLFFGTDFVDFAFEALRFRAFLDERLFFSGRVLTKRRSPR
jgi:hypothetical protein